MNWEQMGSNRHSHCVKNVSVRSFCNPHFPAFGLNTEVNSVYLQKLQLRTHFNRCHVLLYLVTKGK